MIRNEEDLQQAQREVEATIHGSFYDVWAVELLCVKYKLIPEVIHAGIRQYIILEQGGIILKGIDE